MGPTMDSTITTKGQATIPKAIREHLGLRPGDRVKFFIHADGTVVLLPVVPVTALRGMLRSRRPAATIEQMDEAVAAGIVGARTDSQQRRRVSSRKRS